MSGEKVAICIPYYRHIEAPTAMSLMDLTGRAMMAGINVLPIGTAGCYIEDNRNGCVDYAINTGIDFTHLLWVDGDMIFPGDALGRLLAADKDIVGANYRQRTPPYGFTGVYHDMLDTHLLEPGLHRMRQMPTGLLLTKFDIYRKMGYPWFRPGLHNEPRDDIYFCRKAVDMGCEIWCDHDLTFDVRHITVQEIPWFNREQIVQVSGAQIDNVKAGAAGKERAALSRDAFETPRSAA